MPMRKVGLSLGRPGLRTSWLASWGTSSSLGSWWCCSPRRPQPGLREGWSSYAEEQKLKVVPSATLQWKMLDQDALSLGASRKTLGNPLLSLDDPLETLGVAPVTQG